MARHETASALEMRERAGVERIGRAGQVLLPSVGWGRLAGHTREEAEARVTREFAPFRVSALVRLNVAPRARETAEPAPRDR